MQGRRIWQSTGRLWENNSQGDFAQPALVISSDHCADFQSLMSTMFRKNSGYFCIFLPLEIAPLQPPIKYSFKEEDQE